MSTLPPKPRPPLPEGPFLVVGLARSGSAVAQALAERGEEVIGCDAGHPVQAEGLAGTGVEVNLDVDGVDLIERARCVVKSPGVPNDTPVVAAARARGRAVIGELEVAWRMVPNTFIAVTGTNGKTTVTELIGHIRRRAALPTAVAGNVGTPLASVAGVVDRDATVVCECSSFQLEDADAFAPECAVFLNLAPDHRDRHPTLDEYLDAKLRIFAHQGNDDVAVYNADEPALRGRDLGGCARRVAFCTEPDPDCAVSQRGGVIFWGDDPVIEADSISLLGRHNVENAMAATAASLATGVPADAVREGLESFPGVPHRLEVVGEIDGVAYVNDSKATNVAAATAALRSFERGVHAIFGGSLKGESFEALAEPVSERCVACYLIGEAAERLDRDLAAAREAGVALHLSGGLEDAVRVAAAAAGPGDVVLLAPACASFDAYRDFEARGDHFRALVKGLR
ncbi:MAG TPA: UDP-N-acetylmuramoyl-L-alanine--D-glutamate ligase [Solirubrobacterales bacterium]|jgi:UDP-N-acetylmuramoylalanine--D-glutamate ligase|nr:UDP-N-acetylmuramoyl-L-alanine--D-glutamate ligase [Solirubrobacterales bacterium]